MQKTKDLMTHSDEYQDYLFDKDLIYIRPVLLISALLYALFGVIDYFFYPQYLTYFLKVRFLLVIPLILFGYVYSFHKSFRTMYQYVLTALLYVGGLGIILMIFIINGVNYYYSGLFLIFSIAFFLLRLKTFYSTFGSLLLVISFFGVGIFYSDSTIMDILGHGQFYIFSIIVGFIGSRYFESYRLNQYYQESIIAGEQVVLKKQIFKQYEDIKNYHSSTIFALAKLAESRDQMTGNHIHRVSKVSGFLSNELPDSLYESNSLNKEEFIDTITLASSLHDIGKIAISDIILNKPGKLTTEEFDIMKTHTTIGYEVLNEIEEEYGGNMFISLGKQISKSHHEHWNGKGYPEGLKGNEIPLAARIVAIVDVYDALISQRPYKPAFSKEKSIEIIKQGIGTHFDPIIAKAFIEMVSKSEDQLLYGV